MIPAFVGDASITLSWFLEDEYSEAAEAVRMEILSGSICWVPSLWPLEVTNSILVMHRRARITQEKLWEIHSLLKALPIRVDPSDPTNVFEAGFKLARDHRLSTYDAAYLELARRKGILLASLDKPLRNAATALGIALLPEKV
jgi:predicted nucleic acid-binding protein